MAGLAGSAVGEKWDWVVKERQEELAVPCCAILNSLERAAGGPAPPAYEG